MDEVVEKEVDILRSNGRIAQFFDTRLTLGKLVFWNIVQQKKTSIA